MWKSGWATEGARRPSGDDGDREGGGVATIG